MKALIVPRTSELVPGTRPGAGWLPCGQVSSRTVKVLSNPSWAAARQYKGMGRNGIPIPGLDVDVTPPPRIPRGRPIMLADRSEVAG